VVVQQAALCVPAAVSLHGARGPQVQQLVLGGLQHDLVVGVHEAADGAHFELGQDLELGREASRLQGDFAAAGVFGGRGFVHR